MIVVVTPNELLFSYIMGRTSSIFDDDICFVLDQHAELDFSSSLNNSPQVAMSLQSDTFLF